MTGMVNVSPLAFTFGAQQLLMVDMFDANSTATIVSTLSTGPTHGYSTSAQVFGRGRPLWGPYGQGRVFLPPLGATAGCIYNSSAAAYLPVGKSLNSISTLATHGEGTSAFSDGIQMNNRTVCVIPNNSDYVGFYDIVTGEYTRGQATGVIGSTFSGAQLCLRDGRLTIVCANNAATSPGYIDVASRVLTFSDASVPSAAYGCQLLAQTSRVMMGDGYLDLETDTFSSANTADGLYPRLLTNQTVIVAPLSSARWFSYDFDLTQARQSVLYSSGDKLHGCCYAPNGDLIGAPWDVTSVPYLNTTSFVITNGAAFTGADKVSNAVLLPNGRILFVSARIPDLMLYDHVATPVMPPSVFPVLAGPYFN